MFKCLVGSSTLLFTLLNSNRRIYSGCCDRSNDGNGDGDTRVASTVIPKAFMTLSTNVVLNSAGWIPFWMSSQSRPIPNRQVGQRGPNQLRYSVHTHSEDVEDSVHCSILPSPCTADMRSGSCLHFSLHIVPHQEKYRNFLQLLLVTI